MAEILKTGEAMERALALLEAGEIVAIPTETVYGLAGDATNGEAVARIFEAKGRPRFNPLIAHVSGMAMASEIADFDPLSEKLADAFWPGPLTLVLPLAKRSGIHPLVTAGLDTIALRMPQGFGAELIARFGRPLAAPSANSSGRITSTSAEAVEADLGGKISLDRRRRADRGRAGIDHRQGRRRDGAPAASGRHRGRSHRGRCRPAVAERRATAGIEAPGMLASHYAPGAAVRVGATSVLPGEALLAFGKHRAQGSENAVAMLNLSPSGDLREAAANLFSYLQRLDSSGAETIAVEPIPNTGLGEAINDRLSRAAAPRDICRGQPMTAPSTPLCSTVSLRSSATPTPCEPRPTSPPTCTNRVAFIRGARRWC